MVPPWGTPPDSPSTELVSPPPPHALTPETIRIDRLEHDVRMLRLEWEETYDKVHRLLGKVARRHGAMLAAEKAADEDAPGPTNGQSVGVGPGHPEPRAQPESSAHLASRFRR